MKIFSFPTVDSTSTKACELLRQGESPPFAVLAATQTKGRGRGGHSWISLAGNLHLTLALDPAHEPAIETLPHKAAAILARWLEERHRVRVTVKWPNDLLFGGRKIGGILCESAFRGTECQAITVGIGLNVSRAPDHTELASDLPAISLAELGRVPESLESLAQDLATFWEETSSSLSPETIFRALEAWAIPPAHLWRDRMGTLWRGEPLARDGSLPVSPVDTRSHLTPRLLREADHGLSWVYQGSSPDFPLVVADTGNTATKLALYAPARADLPLETLTLPNDKATTSDFQSWARAIERVLLPGTPRIIHWGSVNDGAFEKLRSLAEEAGWSVLPIRKRPLLRGGSGYALKDLGLDRLALLESHLAHRRRQTPVSRAAAVIVSAGTATTIDVILPNGIHAGGLILPGIATALESLHTRAALLPEVAVDNQLANADPLGHTTLEAMRRGVVGMTLGAIDRARAHAETLSQEPPEIVISGGHGALLAAFYETAVERPHMVLDGLRLMVLGG
jgi:BirA family biotin operon repressor/biotin-[acetyl-CoA-carboxylase] ligase